MSGTAFGVNFSAKPSVCVGDSRVAVATSDRMCGKVNSFKLVLFKDIFEPSEGVRRAHFYPTVFFHEYCKHRRKGEDLVLCVYAMVKINRTKEKLVNPISTG